jgi:surface antigen
MLRNLNNIKQEPLFPLTGRCFRPGRVVRTVRATAVMIVLSALAATAAQAAAGQYSVIGTGSNGLNERAAPASSAQQVGHLANGAVAYIACQVAGTPYPTGGSPASESIWDQLTNGTYVADYWLSTPAVGTFSPGIPQCSPPTPPTTPPKAWGKSMSYNPGPNGQCTYWAEKEFKAFTGKYFDVMGPRSGGAYTYGIDAKAHGWTVTPQPEVDSVVVFPPHVDGASSVGHVAWVTGVSGSTITVTQMNVPEGNPNVTVGRYTVRLGMQFILAP